VTPPRAHVLFVLPVLEPAGAERIVASLACLLPQHGFGTSVICLEDERASVGEALKVFGIPVHGLRLSRRRTLACAKAIARRIPAERPLIVHAHLFHANLAARLAVKRLDKATRAGVHVLSTVHVAEHRFRPWQFALDRLTASIARAEVCVSRAVATFQQQRTGLPETFFRVIENGIHLQRFTPRESPPILRSADGKRKPDPLRVVSVGRLDPQKDFPMLLHAWKDVEETFPAAELVIAGSGPEDAALKALRKKLGLLNVQFPGFVEDIPALLRSADLYVQSSAWEGFGLAVAEAMACALPVVVTDVDSLPEIVENGTSGIVVPGRNPQALSSAMIALLSAPPRAIELGKRARIEALKRFSVERMVADYARLYREILQISD